MSLIIGITGQAGSGKTFVVDALKNKLPFYCLDLDKIGHMLLETPPVKTKVINVFGKSILSDNKKINRKLLGDIVFSDKKKLIMLNNIMHPEIYNWVIAEIKNKKDNVIIIVGALIKEIGLLPVCRFVISIIGKDSKQAEFLKEKKRIQNMQASKSVYENIADIVIKNDYSKEFVDKFIVLVQNLIQKSNK